MWAIKQARISIDGHASHYRMLVSCYLDHLIENARFIKLDRHVTTMRIEMPVSAASVIIVGQVSLNVNTVKWRYGLVARATWTFGLWTCSVRFMGMTPTHATFPQRTRGSDLL